MKRTNSPAAARQRHEAEKKYDWLTPMLDAYAIHEEGLAREVAVEGRRRNQQLACGSGCSACCENSIVPVSPYELRVVSWYVSEELPDDIQDRLSPRLTRNNSAADCPLLLDGRCSVYAVRPLACRGLNVFNTPCAPGEDIAYTRPRDVFLHSRDLGRKVGLRVLDSEPWPNNTRKRKAFEAGVIERSAKPIHEMDWTLIARAIDHFRALRAAQERV